MRNYLPKLLFVAFLSITIIGCKKDEKKLQSITLSSTELLLEKGGSSTLTAFLTPEDIKNKVITWTSNNNNVAEVSQEGIVKAVGPGDATITAQIESILASCKVTVTSKAVNITLSEDTLTANLGDTTQLTAIVTPDDTTDPIIWESDNKDVATVDETGRITIISAGIANITATAGSVSAKCRVEVKAIIYIVGTLSNNTTLLWKNDKETELKDDGIAAVPNDIAVSQKGDVYIVGYGTKDDGSGISIALLWKNGTLEHLSDGTKDVQAKAVFVKGDDVYIVGNEVGTKNKVFLWKNGVQTILPSTNNYAEANSVFVTANDDVYVVGYDESPAVWKNGKREDANGTRTTSLQSIFIRNDKIYYTGYETDSDYVVNPIIWNNNIDSKLSKGDYADSDIYTHSIFVDNNDNIFVAGSKASSPKRAVYWKNGEMVLLNNGYKAADIAVLNNTIYVVGYTQSGFGPFVQKKAALWINDELQNLTSTPKSEARAIYIRTK
jgi:Bacterial surface proteins containing Ig-like domains